jgi:cyclopropane fatty-acyl-phospholipid synthase-like methyltransferase
MNEFDESYRGTPPWDVGHPQAEFVQLERNGEIKGSIIDVGCGTGENSLFFASSGHDVVGVDSSTRAIQKAREKAKEREIAGVEFKTVDALDLSELKRIFDNAIDSGLFHTFTDIQRKRYVKNLRSILSMNGKYFMLCFSDLEPLSWGGPRRVTRKEIEVSFSDGWKINYIKEASFETNFHPDGGRAWLSCITRVS